MKGDTAAACDLIEHLPFTTDTGIGSRARIGLIVLATDFTIEHEYRALLAQLPGVALYQSRIMNSPQITPETLSAMKAGIADAAAVILPGSPLDVVAYGCTSASMVLGEETVFERIHAARPGVKATTPITAAFAAFEAFKAKRIGVLTPYRADVNEIVRKYIEKKGFEVPVLGSFNEPDDGIVASIDAASIEAGIDAITRAHKVDMVFVSCTSVRLMESAARIEQRLGVPVTSSNHAMAWHCLRLAGVTDKLPQFGRLYAA
jgi:maleate isomerase